ncbi:matrixin family metalloprotease [Streptomyces hydrogenans]
MTYLQAAAVFGAATTLALATVNAPYSGVRGTASVVAAARCVEGSETRGFSSVDEGEIRWTESSKYDSLRRHAITEWNRFRKIDIAADGASTVNDLEFRDYHNKNDRAAARWERHGGLGQTDYIYLNKHWLDDVYEREPEYRKNIVVHELGHALGLCHKADSVDSVLRRNASDKTVPTAVDKANYRKLWG